MKKQIEYATSILFSLSLLLLIRSTAVRSLLTPRSALKYATVHTHTHTHMQHINSYWAPPAKCAQCSSSNLLQFKQLTCSFCRCILRQQEVQNMKQPRQGKEGRAGAAHSVVGGASTRSSCCNCRKRNHKPTPKHVNNSGSPQVQSAPATSPSPPHPHQQLLLAI